MGAINFNFLNRAVELALEAEKNGNLPIGAVISLENQIVSGGFNTILQPEFNPGKHAEMNAMDGLPIPLWKRAKDLTIYTTLEPCCMCFGRILLSGIGKVVFGAFDKQAGAGCLLPHLPAFYHEKNKPLWVGPVEPETCDPLFERSKVLYDTI